MREHDTSMGGPGRELRTTNWSLVLHAGNPTDPSNRTYLEKLINQYWKPVYAYIRALRNKGVEDAKDLTQAFFVRLLEKDILKTVHPDRGSFRGFLRHSLRNFVVDAGRRERARRPSDGRALFPLDEIRDDNDLRRYQGDPESQFDQVWNDTVMSASLEELGKRLEEQGLSDYADIFQAYCDPDSARAALSGKMTHRDLADKYKISQSAIRKRIQYSLKTLREILREKIRDYLSDASELEQELLKVVEE